MFGVAGNSMDEILKKIIAEIMTNGEEYSPRNMLIREINGCHFRLDNPRIGLYIIQKGVFRLHSHWENFYGI